MNKTISAGLIGLLFPFFSYAQDTTNLEDVVVTASRTPQKTSDVLSDISVITQKQIQQAGQTSLVDLLKTQPGIEISQSGGIGKASSVFIRGANATHTLVLIDGMRINSATTGTTSLENIPLAQIERVEILRGPASGLYGADAIGGVIQIFTKAAKGTPRFNASVGVGTYGTSIADAGVSGRIENTSFSLQAGIISTNGISSISNKQLATYNPDDDGYHNENFSGKLAQHFSDNHELGLTAYHSDGENYYDGGFRTPLANPRNRFDYRSRERLTSYSIYSKNRFNDTWLSTLRAGQGISDTTSYAPNTANTLEVESLFKTTQNQYSWQNDISTSIGLFTVGTERLEQKLSSSSFYPITERNIQSYLAGWQGSIGSHSMQFNLRNDDNSQFGNHTTGSLAYGYQINPQWRANASLGTAFNAPTFNQLYFPNFGTASLKPEEARNKEIGLNYDKGAHHVSAVYYHNEISDLIINPSTLNNPSSNPGTRTANIDEALLRGLTLSYQGKILGLQFGASADIQRPEDEATGNLLPRRAKEHGTLSLSKRFDKLEIGGVVESSSRRFNDNANTVEMNGYTLLHLYGNYRVTNDWSVNARINNVFDRNYELAKDFGTLGTNAFISIRYAPLL